MTWSLEEKKLGLPPLLWWRFRNPAGDEATLYFGAATRKWYTFSREIAEPKDLTEELRGMLPAEDIAAAMTSAIAYRGGDRNAIQREYSARINEAANRAIDNAIKTSINTLFDGRAAAGAAAGALAKFLKGEPK